MADAKVHFDYAGDQTGLTLELFAEAAPDTIVNGTPDACTQLTNNKGTYEAIVDNGLTGWHKATVKNSGGIPVVKSRVWMTDDTSIHEIHDAPVKLHDGTAYGQVNQVQLGGDAQSTTDLKDFADAGYDPSTNKVQGVVLVDSLNGHTPQTGDSFNRLGVNGAGLSAVPWNSAWDAEVESEATDALTAYGPLKPTTAGRTLDVTATGEAGIDWANIGGPTTVQNLSGTTIKTATDVETDTAAIGVAGVGLTAIPWNASWDAEVQSECTDALNAYDPPTNAEMEARTILAASYSTVTTSDIDAALGTYGALKPTTAGRTLDVSATGEAGVDWANVGSPTTVLNLSGTTIKTATDVETDTAAIGAAGAGLTAIPWNASWDAEVQSEAADALNAYDPPTNAEMEARTILAASYSTLTAGQVDTTLSGTHGAGAWTDAGGVPPTAVEIANQVDTTLSSSHGAGAWGTAAGGSATLAKQDQILAILSGANITASSPVLQDGTVDIVQGDSYADADGRALTWTLAGYTGPLLTSATVTFSAVPTTGYNLDTGTPFLKAGLTPTIVGADVVIKVELTAAETAALAPAPPADSLNYTYQLKVTLPTSGRIITHALGAMTVKNNVA